jgi:hypothetical protein
LAPVQENFYGSLSFFLIKKRVRLRRRKKKIKAELAFTPAIHPTPRNSAGLARRLMQHFSHKENSRINYTLNQTLLNKQLALIYQLDEDEKNALVKIINSMLTKKRMKDLLDGKIK